MSRRCRSTWSSSRPRSVNRIFATVASELAQPSRETLPGGFQALRRAPPSTAAHSSQLVAEPTPGESPPVPARLGMYQLGATLGQGGMAQVYRGTDTVLGRVVAIKVLAPQYAKDQAFVERFRREAQAAARLNHPGVVSVYDTGSDQGIHYIVMEYVDGRTLHEVLRSEGRLQPERAAEVLAQVAEALSFAHHAGIVHRDVKPANIMIGRGGEVKVMDFGIARAVASTATLTATATVLGTASYLSPEQAQGEAVDHRSDIYSLGVVAYECLVGEPPFVADTPVAVAYKHVREDPVLPTALVPEVGEDLQAVVMKALAKNPANRYATAEEMKEDLERVRRGEPVDATPVLAPEAIETNGAEVPPSTAFSTRRTSPPPAVSPGLVPQTSHQSSR